MNPLDRDGFVKVYRRVWSEVNSRLRRRKGADTMGTYFLLVLAADHRTGFVPGSRRTIARGLGIPRQTFFDHTKALAEVEEVEIVEVVNQHQENAGITVVRYGEITRARSGAVRDPGQHAVRDPGQHRPKSGTADPDPRAETWGEEVEDLRGDRIEAIREALATAFGYIPGQITRTPKGWLTRAAKDILAVDGVPCEVRFRVEAFEGRIGRKPLRPIDVANEWPRLDCDRARRARELRDSFSFTYD